jgi:hypothetical protein
MAQSVHPFVQCIEQTLLPHLQLVSEDPHHPVIVRHLPPPWQCLGAGNYAAVFTHPAEGDRAVKIYAPGRPGLEPEAEVYRRLGRHPAYSECFHVGANYLVLRRLPGITLYDCVQQGCYIPPQVIADIDAALAYARRQGLAPHDVHGRNVMMHRGRGLVVDVSDFLHRTPCTAWDDVKRGYQWVYRPLLGPLVRRWRLRVPYGFLNGVRFGYRQVRRWRGW